MSDSDKDSFNHTHVLRMTSTILGGISLKTP